MATADIDNHSSFIKDTLTYDSIITEDELRLIFSDLIDTIEKVRDKKTGDFVNISRKCVDHEYKISDPFLIRHFLLVAVKEMTDHNNNYLWQLISE